MLGRMFSSGIEWQVPNERGEFEVIFQQKKIIKYKIKLINF